MTPKAVSFLGNNLAWQFWG